MMRSSKLIAAILATGALCSGCASQIVVYNDGHAKVEGIPYRLAQAFKKHGRYTTLANGKTCDPNPFNEEIVLASGALYYLNVDAAEFAKTNFTAEFTDTGILKKVSLDSESQASAVMESVSNLVKSAAPLVLGTPGALTAGKGENAAAATAAATGAGGNPLCDSGPVDVVYEEITKSGTAAPPPPPPPMPVP